MQGTGTASQTILARKRPNQLVRLPGKPAKDGLAESLPGSSIPADGRTQRKQQAGRAPASAHQVAQHSSTKQTQGLANGYSKPRQTQLVLSQTALPGPKTSASDAAQKAPVTDARHSAQRMQAEQRGGNPSLPRRTSYARARPNQLLRLQSLSPTMPGRKRGAAAAQDSPAAKLRKALVIRRSLSQAGPAPALQPQQPASRLGAAAVRAQGLPAKRGRANLVYVRAAAQGVGAGGVATVGVPGAKAGAARPAGSSRRLVYRRVGLRAVSQGAASPAARQGVRGSAGRSVSSTQAGAPPAQLGNSRTWRRVRQHPWPIVGKNASSSGTCHSHQHRA